MKIYFAGSIRGGRDDADIYHGLIMFLKSFGQVLTEHVGDTGLTEIGDDGPDDRYIHDRDMKWLISCDLVVAEVSMPSLGVGYEIGWAKALDKPVLCLHRPRPGRPLSAMISGCDKIETRAYSSFEEAQKLIGAFLKKFDNTMHLLPG
ncbi:MAG: nucleoside 2-deoxyribosyltransferase [Proteobacteria bacterium]|nr:nucleoside 2-deoxyribosyltransferase [Pseudomonadota bacterium]